MKLRRLTTVWSIVLVLQLCAQSSIQWQHTYGGSSQESGRHIEVLPDGGFLVAGTTGSTDGDATGCMSSISRIWVLRLDAQGDLLWQRCYGGSGNQTLPYVTTTGDGGFVIACRTNSTDGDVSTPLGSTDIWVFKIDEAGELLWERSLGGSSADDCRGIVCAEDGSLFVYGHTFSTELPGYHLPGGNDYYLAKLTPNGEVLEQRCYGGTGGDAAYSMHLTPEEQIIMVGGTSSTDGDVLVGGTMQRWIVAVGPDLEILWQRTLTASPSGASTHAVKTHSGDLFVVGGTTSTEGEIFQLWGEQDMFAVRLDENLQILHTTAFGGSNDESIWQVLSTTSGGLLAIGNTSSQDGQITETQGMQDAWLVCVSDTLGLHWMQNFGGSQDDGFFGGAYTPDGGLVITGFSRSSDGDLTSNQGGWDLWVVKLGPDQVGIAEHASIIDLRLAPNPVQEVLQVTWSADVDRLTIHDALGKLMHTRNALRGEQQLELAVGSWAAGVYTVRIYGEKSSGGHRFIKQ